MVNVKRTVAFEPPQPRLGQLRVSPNDAHEISLCRHRVEMHHDRRMAHEMTHVEGRAASLTVDVRGLDDHCPGLDLEDLLGSLLRG